jgi:IMP dehydrogenase
MEDIFMANLVNKFALSFNDVLLVPQQNELLSRLDTDLTTRITNHITLQHPICSTNMSTVTEFQMMKTMYDSGSCGFLHRFLPMLNICEIIDKCAAIDMFPIVVSVGVKENDYKIIDYILTEDKKPHVFLVDIAHGDSTSALKMIQYLKSNSDIDVIAGNIATKEAALRMCHAGVNGIRVGIGGSSVCTTRNITGHGVPTLQSIIDCAEIKNHGYDIPIIADGGFKSSGDIVKALAFGAECVSLGTLLAPTSDSPGEIINEMGVEKKKVYGMASKEAQENHKNGLKNGTAAEGISVMLPYQGETKQVVSTLLGGIRSGLTYSGAADIKSLQDNAEYVILGTGGMIESKLL